MTTRKLLLALAVWLTQAGARAGSVEGPYIIWMNLAHVSFANGGNCNTCESDAILDLSGRWVRDGHRCFAIGAVKRAVKSHQESWYKQDSLSLTNAVIDPDQD